MNVVLPWASSCRNPEHAAGPQARAITASSPGLCTTIRTEPGVPRIAGAQAAMIPRIGASGTRRRAIEVLLMERESIEGGDMNA
jgi:hypothetical protein